MPPSLSASSSINQTLPFKGTAELYPHPFLALALRVEAIVGLRAAVQTAYAGVLATFCLPRSVSVIPSVRKEGSGRPLPSRN